MKRIKRGREVYIWGYTTKVCPECNLSFVDARRKGIGIWGCPRCVALFVRPYIGHFVSSDMRLWFWDEDTNEFMAAARVAETPVALKGE